MVSGMWCQPGELRRDRLWIRRVKSAGQRDRGAISRGRSILKADLTRLAIGIHRAV